MRKSIKKEKEKKGECNEEWCGVSIKEKKKRVLVWRNGMHNVT